MKLLRWVIHGQWDISYIQFSLDYSVIFMFSALITYDVTCVYAYVYTHESIYQIYL